METGKLDTASKAKNEVAGDLAQTVISTGGKSTPGVWEQISSTKSDSGVG